jgi:hypothetical protein
VLNERHLRRLLRAYVAYYNGSHPHQALQNNSPTPREVQPPSCGRIRAVPEVGGLLGDLSPGLPAPSSANGADGRSRRPLRALPPREASANEVSALRQNL